MSFSEELLAAVSRAETEDAVRVFRPGPTLAFGRLDRRRAGFEQACRVAAAHGRTPLVRLAGGHVVAYDQGAVIIELIRRHERSFIGLEQRFEELAELITQVCAGIGVELELGELPGEYCPGRFSLHLVDGPKIAGIAQRVLARASLTTAVIAVQGGAALRALTAGVYAALELPLEIGTVGAIADRYPSVTAALVEQAFVEQLRSLATSSS